MTFHPKNEPKFPKFHYLISCVFAHFGADFSLQSALQMQKCIIESFSGYLQYTPPPTGVDYSGVIAGRVRSPEMKNILYRKSKEYLKKGLFDNITLCHTLCTRSLNKNPP